MCCAIQVVGNVIYTELLSYVRGFIICKRDIVVSKYYLEIFVVGISFHNISKYLTFKPDDNYVSLLDQVPR
jgi:hypothetical protein